MFPATRGQCQDYIDKFKAGFPINYAKSKRMLCPPITEIVNLLENVHEHTAHVQLQIPVL